MSSVTESNAASACCPPFHDPVPRRPEDLETNQHGRVLFYLVLGGRLTIAGIYFNRYAPCSFSLHLSLTDSPSCRAAVPADAHIITYQSLAEAIRQWEWYCWSTHDHSAGVDSLIDSELSSYHGICTSILMFTELLHPVHS